MSDFLLAQCVHAFLLWMHCIRTWVKHRKQHLTKCTCLCTLLAFVWWTNPHWDMILHDVITFSLISPIILPFLTCSIHLASFAIDHPPIPLLCTMFCCTILSFLQRWTVKAFSRFWLYELMFSWLSRLDTYNCGLRQRKVNKNDDDDDDDDGDCEKANKKKMENNQQRGNSKQTHNKVGLEKINSLCNLPFTLLVCTFQRYWTWMYVFGTRFAVTRCIKMNVPFTIKYTLSVLMIRYSNVIHSVWNDKNGITDEHSMIAIRFRFHATDSYTYDWQRYVAMHNSMLWICFGGHVSDLITQNMFVQKSVRIDLTQFHCYRHQRRRRQQQQQ